LSAIAYKIQIFTFTYCFTKQKLRTATFVIFILQQHFAGVVAIPENILFSHSTFQCSANGSSIRLMNTDNRPMLLDIFFLSVVTDIV